MARMLRRNPTRDEFLNYLSAQRMGRKRNVFTTPLQKFSKLVDQSPTQVLMPNTQNTYSDLVKKRRRAMIQPTSRRAVIQPTQVTPLG